MSRRISSIMFMRIRIGLYSTIRFSRITRLSPPRALPDELVFKLKLAPPSTDVIGSDKAQLAYEFTNIQLE